MLYIRRAAHVSVSRSASTYDMPSVGIEAVQDLSTSVGASEQLMRECSWTSAVSRFLLFCRHDESAGRKSSRLSKSRRREAQVFLGIVTVEVSLGIVTFAVLLECCGPPEVLRTS